ncbi:MAG: CbbQ/NirQ/NorQ C-terminal domain-containing protein, partial [Gammaproteobacteria bacterium]
LDEGASTRMLIYAAQLMSKGISLQEACEVALVLPITDDLDIRNALSSAIEACA